MFFNTCKKLVKKMPLITVIIPTYNRVKILSRAIKSVLKQTYQNFELIIVDDCSTDNTQKALKKFKDKRIFYIKHKKRKGASAARNTGIKKAKGKYLAFLDSDDCWLPEKLEKQLATLQKNKNAGIVYSRFWIVKNGKKKLCCWPEIKKYNGWLHRQLLIGNFITTSSVLVKRQIFDKVGLFDKKLPAYQDWEFFLRASLYEQFAFIDKPLLTQYQNRKDRISADKNKLTKAVRYILKKHGREIKKDRKIYARFLSMAGFKLKAWLLQPTNLRYLKETLSPGRCYTLNT